MERLLAHPIWNFFFIQITACQNELQHTCKFHTDKGKWESEKWPNILPTKFQHNNYLLTKGKASYFYLITCLNTELTHNLIILTPLEILWKFLAKKQEKGLCPCQTLNRMTHFIMKDSDQQDRHKLYDMY